MYDILVQEQIDLTRESLKALDNIDEDLLLVESTKIESEPLDNVVLNTIDKLLVVGESEHVFVEISLSAVFQKLKQAVDSVRNTIAKLAVGTKEFIDSLANRKISPEQANQLAMKYENDSIVQEIVSELERRFDQAPRVDLGGDRNDNNRRPPVRDDNRQPPRDDRRPPRDQRDNRRSPRDRDNRNDKRNLLKDVFDVSVVFLLAYTVFDMLLNLRLHTPITMMSHFLQYLLLIVPLSFYGIISYLIRTLAQMKGIESNVELDFCNEFDELILELNTIVPASIGLNLSQLKPDESIVTKELFGLPSAADVMDVMVALWLGMLLATMTIRLVKLVDRLNLEGQGAALAVIGLLFAKILFVPLLYVYSRLVPHDLTAVPNLASIMVVLTHMAISFKLLQKFNFRSDLLPLLKNPLKLIIIGSIAIKALFMGPFQTFKDLKDAVKSINQEITDLVNGVNKQLGTKGA